MTGVFFSQLETGLSKGVLAPVSERRGAKEGLGGVWRAVNYLCWQMFTDPNMHEFVDLAALVSCQTCCFFMMHAGAVVILAALQSALI